MSVSGRLYLSTQIFYCSKHSFNFVLYCFLSVSINGSNSRMFVSGSCDGTARLWDTRVASRAVRTFHGHEGDVNSVKFFPDGNRFGTGSDDGSCRLFDMRTGHQLQVYNQQHGDNEVPPVTSIAFSISGRLLFAGYSNGDCYVWDTLLARVCCTFLLKGSTFYIRVLIFTTQAIFDVFRTAKNVSVQVC